MPMMPVDDREQVIRPLTPRSLRAVASGPDPSRAAMARYLRQAVTAEAQRWTLGRAAGGVAAALAIVAILVFLSYSRVLRGSGTLIGFLCMATVVHLVFRAMAARKISGELATTAVASGLCGQCGYTLADLDAQGDGCLVCPECGAAWRALRIIAPHWVHADPRRVKRPRGSRWWTRFLYLVPKTTARLGPDDRGRIVPILDSRLRALAPEVRTSVPAPELRSLTRVLRRNGRVGRLLVSVPGLGLAALCGWHMLRTLLDRDGYYEEAAAWGLFGAIFLTMGVLMNLGHSFYSPRRAARVFADLARCGSCACDLRHRSQGADGLVECPRCASAWRVPGSPPLRESPPMVSFAGDAAAPAGPPP